MFTDQEIHGVKAPDYEAPLRTRPSSHVRYARARILKPTRSTMQSGRKKYDHWVLEFEPSMPDAPDYLMGWVGSSDVLKPVHLDFPTKEAAIAFCEKEGVPYEVKDPPRVAPRRRSYAENFAFDRVEGSGSVASGQFDVAARPPGPAARSAGG